jgi:hypothetical protein
MNNLVDKSEFADLQQELNQRLNQQLANIGDDFQRRDYYLQKWNVRLDESRKAINYWDFNKGTGLVQSPGIN